MTQDNVIKVGNRGVIPYALAILAQFNNGESTVRVVARGRSVQRAIDAVAVVRKYMLHDVIIKKTKISCEGVEREAAGESTVSTIELVLIKELAKKPSKT